MSENDWLGELVKMLHFGTRKDVRLTASKNVLALTGSPDGRLFIRQNLPMLEAIFANITDESPMMSEHAILEVVNLSADEPFTTVVLEKYNILPTIVKERNKSKNETAIF